MNGNLTTEDRARLEQLFDQGADLPPDEHAAFVARVCEGRPALADELSRLLAAVSGDDVLTAIQTSGGAADLPGTRIGPYQLEELVGRGGMGEVWRARQLEPVTRTVALKLIRSGMDSAQVVARFAAERQALARMSHPHVAQVLGGGSADDGRPYFVMEYVDGEPLTTWCDSHGLSTRERLELFLDVCDGVGHAHQKGLIHRDLKPSNVLVTEQDGRPVAKVIDFGVARATTGRLAQRTLHTLVGQLVGTLDYMSPEQADPGAAEVDTRSDVYSLGVVLYELLSGALPFDHGTVLDRPLSEIQRAIREEDPPTPSTRFKRRTDTSADVAQRRGVDERGLVRELDGDLDVICLHALQKQPERRYASVADMAEDVRRHLAHEPVLARRPSAAYRMRKFARRHRVGVSAAAVVVVALLVGAYGIMSGRLAAEAKAVELQRLSDAWRVGPLIAEADQLWPEVPATLPAIEGWLMRARTVVERLDASLAGSTAAAGVERFDASLARATVADVGSGPADVAVGDLPPDLWESLAVLRDGLLAADGTSGAHGASVPLRLARAGRLAADHAPGGALHRAWSDALPAIHAAYPGLALAPQIGLLPLGTDPRSGLWEFAHLPSGEPASRVDGELLRDDTTGLVLVLLPGGTFFMGSQRDDPEGPNYVEGLGPIPQLTESPVKEASVDPFFMSKYEVTRAQWRRLMGIEPLDHEGDMTPTCPINYVSWLDSTAYCARAGLVLPDEVQWEYAARSGTDTPWWTGKTDDSVRGRANLLESSITAAALSGRAAQRGTPWVDGFEKLAPVGSFEANLFGLHDVIGNVVEWTASFTAFTEGKTPIVNRDTYRMARGGAYSQPAAMGRAAVRAKSSVPEYKTPDMGFRPARAVVW